MVETTGFPATASTEAILLERSIGWESSCPGTSSSGSGNTGITGWGVTPVSWRPGLGPERAIRIVRRCGGALVLRVGARPANRRFLRGYAEFELDPPTTSATWALHFRGWQLRRGRGALQCLYPLLPGRIRRIPAFERKVGPLPCNDCSSLLSPGSSSGETCLKFDTAPQWSRSCSRFGRSAVSLPKSFEFRVMEHGNVWLGRHGAIWPGGSRAERAVRAFRILRPALVLWWVGRAPSQ